MAISEKVKQILDEMLNSGSSEAAGVADILKTISENGGDQETDSHLLCCAEEIRNAADSFIKQMRETTHVVLFVGGGIPEDPELFECYDHAIARYRELAKANLSIEGDIDKMSDGELFHAVHSRVDSDDDLYLYETKTRTTKAE